MRLLLLLPFFTLKLLAADPTLLLTADRTSCNPGETITFTLRLSGAPLSPSIHLTPNLKHTQPVLASLIAPSSSIQELHTIFAIEAKDLGTFQVGPFSLDIDGKSISSNAFSYEVALASVGAKEILASASKARTGQQITIALVSTTNDIAKVTLKVSTLYDVDSVSTGNSVQTTNGKRVATYRKTFTLIIKAKGVLEITPDLFEGLSGETTIPIKQIKLTR